MSFPGKVKEDALIACSRHCCICHKFCGIKMELHHIVQKKDGGEDTFENAIPLCFDCHSDMRSYDHKHPKGLKYASPELMRHREAWYKKVKGNIGIANRSEIVETDKKVYQKLIEVLPWKGSIDFIRSNNFAGFSFQLDLLDDLFEFEYLSKNPAFEFVDPDLEGIFANLSNQVTIFNSLITVNTFPTRGATGRNEVPPEWEEKNPEKFREVVTEIHQAAENVCSSYNNLIRLATRKLGVLPDKLMDF